MTDWRSGLGVGPYQLLAPIGAGGMGEVWKARDTRLNRTVAIKRLKGEHGARFEQEARAIAALNHPHICQIFDVGPDYLVLEYIEGKPLRGPLPAAEAVKLALQVASALEEAHSKGILHRDLKPANILLTAKREAKLLDFGLARLTANADADATRTIEGTILGTAAYMAPEQAQGQPFDVRSDIFSFGAVLYELFSGRRAFPGEHALSIIADVVHKEPEPLHAAPDIVRIVTRCLRKSPGERFQTVAELRAALEAARITEAAAPEQPSIAVLPFANMSSDKEQEYFSDGLAEEILNLLAKIPSLKVIARTSSFAFRGKEQDITEIANKLKVRTILEGSVRRAGNRIRVTAQLIDASDGSHLWSERYDRQLTDVFEVQDEIATAIAGALQLKLAPGPAAAQRYKPSLPAYEAYLRGRHHFMQLTAASMALSRECYEKAIALDPKFAPAYAELAAYYGSLALLGLRPAQEVIPQAQFWAQKALELDPSLPEANVYLAQKAMTYDYDWSEAGRLVKAALAYDPAPAIACWVNALYLIALGRAGEAEARIRRMVEADPLTVFNRHYLALLLAAMGRDREAEAEFHHVLELDERFAVAWRGLAALHFGRGEMNEAADCIERAYSLSPFMPSITGAFAGMLARNGDPRRAEELLAELGPPEAYGVPIAWAMFHLYRGETEKALDWWEKVIEQRDPNALFVTWASPCNLLRASPRWPALAKKMNLPESAS